MQKVTEPVVGDIFECPRCKQNYCSDCVDSVHVDFHIWDAPEGINEKQINWLGEDVCPWCYNQLIDLKEKREKGE